MRSGRPIVDDVEMERDETKLEIDEVHRNNHRDVSDPAALSRRDSSYLQQWFVGATVIMSGVRVWSFVHAAISQVPWEGLGNILASTALVAVCALGMIGFSIPAIAAGRRHAGRLLVGACMVLAASVILIDVLPPLVRHGPCHDWHGNVEPCD